MLKKEIDDLEDQIRKLKLVVENRDDKPTRLKRDLVEWQNRERRVSKKEKKKSYY
jgi:hypothetical protein